MAMCSASISTNEDLFLSDYSDNDDNVEAVNHVGDRIFKQRKFYSSCRSGDLKSLSLDKISNGDDDTSKIPLDSLVTKSLLEMTKVSLEDVEDIKESSDFLQDISDQTQLSATILDNSGGICNSFDTTVACDDVIAEVDEIDDDTDDNDSGVHNTPDILNKDDDIDTSFDILTNDSLYESLKYQQGKISFFTNLNIKL